MYLAFTFAEIVLYGALIFVQVSKKQLLQVQVQEAEMLDVSASSACDLNSSFFVVP
jgi:hypothetical protein